jgi:hypothetical protein
MSTKLIWVFSLGFAALAAAGLGGSFIVPLDHEAIQYAKRPVRDPVHLLGERIARGEVKLEFNEVHGYLRSLLNALEVPIESQVLVFSKTSFQAALISPQRPRALSQRSRRRRLCTRQRCPGTGFAGPSTRHHFLHARQRKNRAAAISAPRRRVFAVPPVRCDAGCSRASSPVRLPWTVRHANVPGRWVHHRPP